MVKSKWAVMVGIAIFVSLDVVVVVGCGGEQGSDNMYSPDVDSSALEVWVP